MNREQIKNRQKLDPEKEEFLFGELPHMVGERLSDLQVSSVYTGEVKKNNGVKYYAMYADVGGGGTSPCVYLDELLEDSVCGLDDGKKEMIADIIANSIRTALSEADRLPEELISAKDIPERLGLRLINREENRELLNEIPHRDYLDLSAILVWYMDLSRGKGVIRLNQHILDELGYSFDELYPMALSNMQFKHPSRFRYLEDMLNELLPCQMTPVSIPLYCLTVEDISYGAVAMLYSGKLKEIYEYLGEAYYVIPSSVNELLIMPSSVVDDRFYLMDMIHSVNDEAVEATEVLSDSLYFYSPDRDDLELCPDERKGTKFCAVV